MEIIQDLCLTVLGFTSGLAVAAGMFSFISVLGVIPRLCSCFHAAKHIYQVENCVAAGSLLGTIFFDYLKIHYFAVGV